MNLFTRFARSAFVCAAMAFALTLSISAPAHAVVMYVDKGLPDLTPDQIVHVANPQPVQLLFQLQTKERPNSKGTTFLKAKVLEAVKNSGLFTDVTDGPATNGAVLSITIDNIPEANAGSKGFGTGLTFGLVGTVVTDYYVCTVEYLPPSGVGKITKTANHSLHSTIGLKSAPLDGIKAKNVEEGVFIMTRQIVSHALNSLGEDPAFSGTPAQPAQGQADAPTDAATAAPAETVPAAAPAPAATDETPAAQVAS